MGKAKAHHPNGVPRSESDRSPSNGPHRRVGAGEFKATCLKLMDEVEATGTEIIITKRNRPVAKLVPARREGLRPFVGRSRGVIWATREDLMAPIGENWQVDADL